LAGTKLDIVHLRTQRHLTQRQRIANAHVGTGTGDNRVTYRQALRVKDVALLAILVLHECYTSRAVGIVLDLTHNRGQATLVALEIDEPVLPLGATTAATHGYVTVIVATTATLERLGERLLGRTSRDLAECRDAAAARALRNRLDLADYHRLRPRTRSRSCLRPGASRPPTSNADGNRPF